MKKYLAIILVLCLCTPAFAVIPTKKIQNPPIGSFKKQKNGTFVQYNDKGKKIGIYKLENNNLVRIK